MPIGNPGIPRTAGCDDIRRNHIKTRLTDKEVLMVDAHAARIGVSRSAAIRSLLIQTLSEHEDRRSDYALVTAKCA